MALEKKKKEIRKILQHFEVEADKYHDILLSAFFLTKASSSSNRKFHEKNHTIMLWQYYGKVSNNDDSKKILFDIFKSDLQWGMQGAEFSAFAVIEGEKTDLFVKIAKRIGSLFSDKERNQLQSKLLDDIKANDKQSGKAVYTANRNPLAVWINYIIYHLSITHPIRFSLTQVKIDPFLESARAIEHLLSKGKFYRGNNSVKPIDKMEFSIALSFPGEKREYVEKVADLLQSTLGEGKVFYDFFYQAYLARPNLDILLQKIYRKNSKLIVIFLSKEYSEKEWCGLELRAIRDLIKSQQDEKIMFMRFDDADIDGIFSTDGYIDVSNTTPEDTTKMILQRLSVLSSNSYA